MKFEFLWCLDSFPFLKMNSIINSCMKFSRYMLRTTSFHCSRWAWVDSNHRPHAYQACALTTWATSPFGLRSLPRPAYSIRMISHPSGEYEIRTRDLLLARQALSQLSYIPMSSFIYYLIHLHHSLSLSGGSEWTWTTDLTLIRGAL